MSTAAIVPVKPLRDGKTRLSGFFSKEYRERLSEAMLLDVLCALVGARSVGSFFIVSEDTRVLSICNSFSEKKGVEVREPSARGVNAALVRGIDAIYKFGIKGGHSFSHILVIPADLPLVTSKNIEFTCDQVLGNLKSVVIAPSLRLDGTNLLVMPLEKRVDFSYDDESFRNHIASAERKGLQVKILLSDAFMRDVDTREDIVEMVSTVNHETHTSKFLSKSIGNVVLNRKQV